MRRETTWGEGAERQREVVRVLSGGSVRDQLEVNLTEPGETVRILVAYCGQGWERLRLDYRVNHLAPETKSEILVCGVLKGAVQKELKMTIDFRRGCTGARGEEREDAMLLSDQAVSQAHPVIYCGEESVLGTHGASTGRLDERAISYLMARGLTRVRAQKLLVRAKLWQIVGRIKDEKTQAAAIEQLEQVIKSV